MKESVSFVKSIRNGIAEETTPMTGWKTKLGSFLVAIAGTMAGASEIVPIEGAAPWVKLAAFVVGGVGSAFVAWGIAHKLEKNKI